MPETAAQNRFLGIDGKGPVKYARLQVERSCANPLTINLTEAKSITL